VFYLSLRGASTIGLVASNSGIALMMEKFSITTEIQAWLPI